jgi:4-diphosphocytidyl-2C-methyl-D-erythritol kinase
MKPVNVETLLNHSTGISDSYYRPRESELLEEYLAVAEQHLSVSTENKFKSDLEELRKNNKEYKEKFKRETEEREKMHNDFMAQILDRITALEAREKSRKK